MELLTFQIEAQSPLVFPERKPGVQFNASLPYVPGAVIYGALGQQFGPQGFNAALFRELRCANAYPTQPDDVWVRPLPATALQPKSAERDLPLHDALIAQTCWEQQTPTALIYAPADTDGRPLQAVGSRFYTLSNPIAYREVQQRVLTRVAINRARGTAQESRLYSPLAISEVTYVEQERAQTRFRGRLAVPTTDVATVRQALQAITHLGGRQTSGLGAVTISLDAQPAVADDAAIILGRVQALTARFQQQAALYAALGGEPWPITDGSIFTVGLLADAILYEDGWIPTQVFSPQQLFAATGINATLLRAYAATKTVGGWQMLWQRPKPTDVAVAMGSVYVFQTAAPLDEAACATLAQLQIDGIGERRSEGYGQVRICDEFHLLNGRGDDERA